MRATQSCSRVSVFNPRKSIFKRPMLPISSMAYCVTISSSFVRARGEYSTMGRGEITTPAACTEACRVSPSSLLDTSRSCRMRSSLSRIWRSAGTCWMALSMVMSGSAGIILAIRSQSPYGMSSPRPASRTTAFAPMVAKVMICATLSRPYLSRT